MEAETFYNSYKINVFVSGSVLFQRHGEIRTVVNNI